MLNILISENETIFHERVSPEKGYLIGYGALIFSFKLAVPIPYKLSLISKKHKKYSTEQWNIFTPRHQPEGTLSGALSFALKYEGIDLHVLKAIFSKTSKNEIENIVLNEPHGKYSRKIWFLYEWLRDDILSVPDLKSGNFVDLVDPELQYPGPSENSPRHRLRNNLPGVKNFCPLIRRTEKLDYFITKQLNKSTNISVKTLPRNLLMRASSFLLLKDSKASYAIEGESPPQNRAQKWGRAIGQAGKIPLSKDELLRLQQLVIESERFFKFGWRKQGGFIGEHDRKLGMPIPEHISAKWEDIDNLISGLIETYRKLENSETDPVLVAALIAFGFVFIHPFTDGNGRIHRYIIHHVLAKMNFTPRGFIFPVSSAILERIDEYRDVLISYSYQLLELIKWQVTSDNNVEVLNDTIDLYRYFDATKQAEFLYSCVEQTIEKIVPEEIEYLYNYDRFKAFIDERFEMPDWMVSLLVSFLNQGSGKLSKRVKTKEFSSLTDDEIISIEKVYSEILGNNPLRVVK